MGEGNRGRCWKRQSLPEGEADLEESSWPNFYYYYYYQKNKIKNAQSSAQEGQGPDEESPEEAPR